MSHVDLANMDAVESIVDKIKVDGRIPDRERWRQDAKNHMDWIAEHHRESDELERLEQEQKRGQ